MQTNNNISHYAAIYERYKDQYDQILPETIEELHHYVRKNFNDLKCSHEFVDRDMDDFLEVKRIYETENKIVVSSLNNNSRLFPGDLNLAFRVVHDYIHLTLDLPFTYEGEYSVWRLQAQGLSYQARQVLFSEIVLQASYALHNGYFPDFQKIVLVDVD